MLRKWNGLCLSRGLCLYEPVGLENDISLTTPSLFNSWKCYITVWNKGCCSQGKVASLTAIFNIRFFNLIYFFTFFNFLITSSRISVIKKVKMHSTKFHPKNSKLHPKTLYQFWLLKNLLFKNTVFLYFGQFFWTGMK